MKTVMKINVAIVLLAFSCAANAKGAERMFALLPHHSDILSLHRRIDRIEQLVQHVQEDYRAAFPVDAGKQKADVSNDFHRIALDLEQVRKSTSRLISDLRSLEDRLNDVCATRDRVTEINVITRMKEIIIPKIDFAPPNTVVDAIDFINNAAKDAGGGPSFHVQLSQEGNSDETREINPTVPRISASNISQYDALNLICKLTGFKFEIKGAVVFVAPRSSYIDEDYFTRIYSLTLKDPKRDWSQYLQSRGVTLPENSTVAYEETTHVERLGKLRVTTTEDGFRQMEAVIDDMLKASDAQVQGETIR